MHRENFEFLNLDVRSKTGVEILESSKVCTKLKQLRPNVPMAIGFALELCFSKQKLCRIPQRFAKPRDSQAWL